MEPPWVLRSRFYLQVELQILNLSAQKPLPSRNSLNTEEYPTRRQRSKATQMLKKKKDLQCILYCTLNFHFKAIETFLYTHFSSCHPPGVKRASLNAKYLLDSSETAFKTAFSQFKQISSKEGTLKLWFQQLSQKLHLRVENLPCNKNVNKPRETCLLSHNTSTNNEKQWSYPRQQNFRQKNDTMHTYWPFYTVNPSVPNLKQILMQNWHLIH